MDALEHQTKGSTFSHCATRVHCFLRRRPGGCGSLPGLLRAIGRAAEENSENGDKDTIRQWVRAFRSAGKQQIQCRRKKGVNSVKLIYKFVRCRLRPRSHPRAFSGERTQRERKCSAALSLCIDSIDEMATRDGQMNFSLGRASSSSAVRQQKLSRNLCSGDNVRDRIFIHRPDNCAGAESSLAHAPPMIYKLIIFARSRGEYDIVKCRAGRPFVHLNRNNINSNGFHITFDEIRSLVRTLRCYRDAISVAAANEHISQTIFGPHADKAR